ncbi:MAG: GNAT family N-acetyltransferase [Candidatus Coproplasma sp.]
MQKYTVEHNKLTAEEFIELWPVEWGNPPSLRQTELAMQNSLFRVSVYDGERVVAMARLIGDLGLCYYIKDVVVRSEYQNKGLGKLLINQIINFVKTKAVKGTSVFIELCSRPDKVGFYEKLGLSESDCKSMKLRINIE